MKHAVRAVLQGFHVFPIEPNGKTPIRIYQDRTPEDAPWTIRWSELATNDVKRVVDWWSYAPRANIGIACRPSGIFVMDCDQPKRDGMLTDTAWAYLHGLLGPLVDGETLLDQVAERYGGPEALATIFNTYAVETGSGGKHWYYRWPSSVQSSQASIVKGILDVRGNGGTRGGYVLGAGSQTDAGVYVPYGGTTDIRDAPLWLIELCKERPRPAAPKPPHHAPGSVNFAGLVNSVATAQKGNRNNTLLWSARAMCADGATQEECEELLVPAALTNGESDRQARQTIRSAYRLQARKM